MDFRDVLELGLDESKAVLYQQLEGLTREELTWQPGPESNPIGFIVWHIARVEDRWLHYFIQGKPELWEREGWYQKLGLPRTDTGGRYTAEQVARFPLPDMKQIQAYFDAVRLETLECLRGLKATDLERCPRPEERPGYTVARAMAHLVVEESEHIGQVWYLRGVQRGLGK
jgi:uncharacterized damage-inducible protein DinB